MSTFKRILLLSTFVSLSIGATPIIGVGTHFAWKRDYFDTLVKWSTPKQVTSIRDELYWKDIERSPGVLKFEGRAAFSLEKLTQARAFGLQPLIILSYGNPIYDEGSQPSSPAGRLAFARYAKFVYEHTKEISPIFEVWNEWNIGAGSNPKTKNGSVTQYLELVKVTTTELRRSGFTGKILGGALGDDHPNWPWARQAISMGLLDWVDGLSIHLYNYSNTESKRGSPEFLQRAGQLDSYIKTQRNGESFPIYITEVGWPNHFGLKSISKNEAALDAEILLNELEQHPYIKGVWFYEFMDSGTDPFEKEHHFGILDRLGAEKPVACAIRHWNEFESKVTWTHTSRSEGIRVSQGQDQDGNLVTRVWSLAPLGHTKPKFSMTPDSHNKRRIVHMASCNPADRKGQPFSDGLFPTAVPLTIVSPKGTKAPNFFKVD